VLTHPILHMLLEISAFVNTGEIPFTSCVWLLSPLS